MLYKILKFLYSILSSIWLTIALFLVFFLLCLLGTLFPQGVSLEEYKSAGGKFLFLAEKIGVLDIFHSKWIFLASLLLLVNLLLCNLERARKGFNIIRISSIVYHIMLVCIIVLLYVSSKTHEEREIVLNKGEEKIVEFEDGKFSIMLESFKIDYIDAPAFNLKMPALEKLKVIVYGLDRSKLTSAVDLKMSYREFTADIKVTHNGRVLLHPLRVNNSLVFSGYSVNLFGFEHHIVLRLGSSVITTKPDAPFSAPDGSLYKVSEVFDGNLLMINGVERKLTPEIKLYKKINNDWVLQRVITMGETAALDNGMIEFVDYSYSVYLGAKYDPAVRFLQFFSFFTIVVLFSVIINKMR